MREKIEKFLNKTSKKVKKYVKTNILFLSFVLTSVMNAAILRFLTVKNYFDFQPLLADLAVIIVIGAFGYLLKPKNQFKYFFGFSVFFTILCIVNSMYYTNYLSFASFSLLQTSFQIVDVGDAVVENVMEMKDFCYLWQLLAMFFVNRHLKKINYYEKITKIENGKLSMLNTLITGVIFIGLFISTLTTIDLSRLGKQWNREFVVMKFGIYTYQANDVLASLRPQISSLFGYDKDAKEFRDYYTNRWENEETKSNKYTNIFKGKNVIVIHAESIQNFTMDLSFNGKELTPNLNRLASEGLYFSKFYAQESVGTSSDSEFTFNTALMPATNGTVFINYWDRNYVTIPKLLKEQNYYTFSMHANNGTMWNRNNAHASFGYDNFFYYTKDYEIDETIGLGLSDKSFFKQSIPKIKEINENNQNFYGVLIMLTNHTPFSDIIEKDIVDYDVDYKYEKVNESTGQKEIVSAPYMEGTKLGNYFKSVHYADEAIGEFIDELDENGLLENTVVVIYGDHDAKLKRSEFEYFYNYDYETNSILSKEDENYKKVDFYEYELNRNVPFIIWTKDGKYQREVTKVMGMYDVLPTLGNMMGFSSDYALGHDIFSINENVVVFPDGNWLTDKMYYNHQKEEGKMLNENETVSVDYIEKYNQYSEELISVSNSIIVYDLVQKNNENNWIARVEK